MMDLSEGVVSYFLLNLQYFFTSIVLKLEQNVLQDEKKKKKAVPFRKSRPNVSI